MISEDNGDTVLSRMLLRFECLPSVRMYLAYLTFVCLLGFKGASTTAHLTLGSKNGQISSFDFGILRSDASLTFLTMFQNID